MTCSLLAMVAASRAWSPFHYHQGVSLVQVPCTGGKQEGAQADARSACTFCCLCFVCDARDCGGGGVDVTIQGATTLTQCGGDYHQGVPLVQVLDRYGTVGTYIRKAQKKHFLRIVYSHCIPTV